MFRRLPPFIYLFRRPKHGHKDKHNPQVVSANMLPLIVLLLIVLLLIVIVLLLIVGVNYVPHVIVKFIN